MKKTITALLLLCVLVGCASNQKLTVESLQAAKSKQDLAKTINCDYKDLETVIANLNNLYKSLPAESNGLQPSVTYDEAGHVILSKETLLQYIKKIELTTDNWKDYYEARVVNYQNINAFGEVEYEDTYVVFGLKEGVTGDEYEKIAIKLHDDVNDIDLIYSHENFNSNSDEYYCDLILNSETYYDFQEEFAKNEIMLRVSSAYTWDEKYYKFDINNLTCTQITGYVFTQNIPEEYIIEEEEYGGKYVIYGDANSYHWLYIDGTNSFDDLFE